MKEKNLRPYHEFEIAFVVAWTLCKIHKAGFAHQHVNPSNVLFGQGEGQGILVQGFGRPFKDLNGISAEKSIYIEPRLRKENVQDLKSLQDGDIYSLGVLLYKLFTLEKYNTKPLFSCLHLLPRLERIVISSFIAPSERRPNADFAMYALRQALSISLVLSGEETLSAAYRYCHLEDIKDKQKEMFQIFIQDKEQLYLEKVDMPSLKNLTCGMKSQC